MRHSTTFEALAITAALAAATAAIALTGLDLKVLDLFYVPGAGFPYGSQEPWETLYRYGTCPSLLMGAAACALFVAALFLRWPRSVRRGALFVLLLLAICPGILVEHVVKEGWGRPRPSEITHFGGAEPFHQPWERGEPGGGRSFPSGHATAGYFLMAPYFVLRRSSPRWARGFLLLGLGCGTLLGYTRMVQGGHFPSDVLWSGGLLYLCGILLAAAMRVEQ